MIRFATINPFKADRMASKRADRFRNWLTRFETGQWMKPIHDSYNLVLVGTHNKIMFTVS